MLIIVSYQRFERSLHKWPDDYVIYIVTTLITYATGAYNAIAHSLLLKPKASRIIHIIYNTTGIVNLLHQPCLCIGPVVVLSDITPSLTS